MLVFWDLSTSAFFCFHIYMTFLLHQTTEVLEVRGCVHVCSVAQLCLTLCDSMDSNPPGSSVHGILWARIFEWVAMPSSRESSQTRDQTHVCYVSCLVVQNPLEPPGKPYAILIFELLLPRVLATGHVAAAAAAKSLQ